VGRVPPIGATLYWFAMSHPAQAARRMLDVKGVDYELAGVMPGTQRIHLRLAGFRGGTVPALKLDGRRVQGTRAIARALDRVRPEPPFFPGDPELRARAEEAERWGDEELQEVPRRLLRWGLVRYPDLRRWMADQSRVPAPAVLARLSIPAARYYARAVGADEPAVRRALAELPRTLDRVDALLAEGVLETDPPNAAALQVLCSVRALSSFADLRDQLAARPSAAAARELFPSYDARVPRFLPREWVT
jgi:glutathione S-transferase